MSEFTLDDVAASAGVSTATVSRFFNSPDVVAPATAERIKAAVEQLGYIPNLLAGGLASSRSRLVAVMIPELAGSLFAETIEAMVGELSSAGYVSLLGLTEHPHEQMHELAHAALARRVEALVVTSTVEERTRLMLRQSGTTVIEIWDLPDDPIDIAIGFSHKAIGQDLARSARNRGYQRPHLITANSSRACQRRDSFVAEWVAGGGGMPSESAVALSGHYGDARPCFAALMNLERRPDLVICGSDPLAQGIVIEAREAGLRVPEDLAVIGFGNTRLSEEMRPAITSVDIDGARIARETVALLRQRAEGLEPSDKRVDVGFRLITRETA